MKKPRRLMQPLAKAIFDLHGSKAKWVESVTDKETFEGKVLWEGSIEVFDLKNQPTAKRAYARSRNLDHSRNEKGFCCTPSRTNEICLGCCEGIYYW